MSAARDLEAEVLAWIDARVRRMLEAGEIPEWTRALDDAILADVPEVDSDPLIRDTLDASTAAALTLYVSNMPGLVPGSIAATPEMQDLGRGLAQRGADVSVLLRAYRVGQRVFWSRLMGEINQEALDQELRSALLDFLWDHLSRTLESAVQDVVAAYVAEAEQRLRGVFARRADIVAAVLRGDPVDVRTASAQLSHRLAQQQTAIVLWAEDSAAEDTVRSLDRAARAIATALGLAAPLTLPSGERRLWAWVASPGEPALDRLAELSELTPDPGIRIALGETGTGPDGFRTSHEQALRAQAVAEEAPGLGRLIRYRDVAAMALLASEDSAMREFVRRELGALGEPGTTEERLRETVLAYLTGGSSARAAELLTVHKNTVLYRLQQAAELLGRPLDERRFELEAALRLAATYGL